MESDDNFSRNSFSEAEILLPRLNIAVYGLGEHLLDVASQVMIDRRLVNSKVSIYNGGIRAAIDYYKNNMTPNILIIEVEDSLSQLMNDLFELSEFCDAETHVIIAGRINDVELYRELIRNGISEYLVLPTTPTALITAISNLYQGKMKVPYAPAIAFIGAAGGVGTSMIAQSVALSISEYYQTDTIFLDLDRTYPMSSLSWSITPNKGFDTLLQSRFADIDDKLVKSCLIRITNNLNLLSNASSDVLDNLDNTYLDYLIDIIKYTRILSDYIVMDVPSGDISVEKYAGLLNASKIFIVTEPTIKGIRNLGMLYDNLLKIRPNDQPPYVILNKTEAPDTVHLDDRIISDNIGISPDVHIQYIPEVIDLAIARGAAVSSVSGSDEFNQGIQHCVDIILGKSSGRAVSKSFVHKIITDFQKVIGL